MIAEYVYLAKWSYVTVTLYTVVFVIMYGPSYILIANYL